MMAEDKTAELVQTVKDTVKNENSELTTKIKNIETSLDGYASKEVVDGIKEVAEKAVTQKELTAVKQTLDLVDQAVKAIKEAPKSEKRKDSIYEYLNKEEIKEEFDTLKDSNNTVVRLKNFSVGGNFEGTTSGIPFLPIDQRDTIAETPDLRTQFNILNYINVGSTNAQTVTWQEEDTETGSALFIKECVAKPEVSKDWKKNKTEVKKVADFAKVCDEVLMYMPKMRQLIEQFLRKLVYIAIQEAIINGDGDTTGDNDNILGIIPQSTVFVAGTKAGSVPSANHADAIRAVASQIRCLGFQPNLAFVNCDDIFQFESIKDGNGQYLNAPLGGVQLIECPFLTPGEFLVGDFSLANVDFFENIMSEWARSDDDFRRNRISVRSEALLAFYIASNHLTGFVTDSFANVITLINKA